MLNMSAGKLRNRISILELSSSTSENGFRSDVWNPIRDTWSYMKVMKRSPRIVEEDNIKEDIFLTFVIRYQEINQENRIQFQNKIYQLLGIEDEDLRKRYLTITAKEVN